FPGLPDAAEAPHVEGYDAEAASLGAEEQARLAAAAIDASDLDLYGFFTSGVSGIAVAATTGLAVSQELTDVAVLALAAVGGGPGSRPSTAPRGTPSRPAGEPRTSTRPERPARPPRRRS